MARPRTHRSTIKNDPFAALIPEPPKAEEVEIPPQSVLPKMQQVANEDAPQPTLPAAPVAVPPSAAAPASLKKRHKITIHLDEALVNRVKNAAYWNPRLTIARIAERGLRLAIQQVEKENGGPYPQRESELIGGRPIK